MSRPPTSTLIGRALRLKCPRCGEGSMFSGLFKTRERCPHCQLKFEREPGYFLGSIYLNYGLTAFISTAVWVVLRFGYGFPARNVMIGLGAFCVLFPSFYFRYARALWVALDLRFDESQFVGLPKTPPKDSP
ncbi:MAG: DUF983 domain-containing protein [Planctomycetota bacterium]|nr:DUF983 domain-containing protein [Planctomycetota bacterium]